MSEYAEEEEAVRFSDVMQELRVLSICKEFHKLPHEVKEEDAWTIELLATSLKAIRTKTEMDIKKKEFIARNRGK